MTPSPDLFEAELLDADTRFSMAECVVCTHSPEAFIVELITENIIVPEADGDTYLFTVTHIQTIRRARSYHVDLGVNTPGIALALQLLARIETLEAQ